MDQRKNPPDRELLRQQRNELYDLIDRGELPLREAVKRMRALSGLTQVEFAAHRGVSLKVIKGLERGQGNPTLNTLNQVAGIFGLEVAFVRKKRVE